MTNHTYESGLMKFCRKLGLETLAWSLRLLHCPVDNKALVLEVGSGGNPYFSAKVLLDAFEPQRHSVPLIAGRPTVMARSSVYRFVNKAFDFVIASPVLEHSSDQKRFCPSCSMWLMQAISRCRMYSWNA